MPKAVLELLNDLFFHGGLLFLDLLQVLSLLNGRVLIVRVLQDHSFLLLQLVFLPEQSLDSVRFIGICKIELVFLPLFLHALQHA